MKPVDLDDLDALAALDSEDVLGAVEAFADQIQSGWDIGAATSGLPEGTGVDSVVVLGMGGSGVSGDVAEAVVGARIGVPWRTIKSYGPIPEWVGRNTLVVAVSYSGSTEETVEALKEVHKRGARAIAVSSGGPLAELASEYGLAHVAIPSGLQPRASLGYLTLPLLAVLCRVGLVPDLSQDVDETTAVVADLAGRCHRKTSRPENPAKDLASRIHGRVPVVYGGYPLGSTAAYRFKCDLNEYGKTPSSWHSFPELNHNEIVGWNQLEDLTKERFLAIFLRDPEDHPRVALRFDITKDLIAPRLADIIELTAQGESALARLMSLIFVTQMAAIYVGLSYGIDPGPVEVIQALKAQLAQRQE